MGATPAPPPPPPDEGREKHLNKWPIPTEVATDEDTSSSKVFNTNNFMRNEFVGLMSDVGRPNKQDARVKRAQGEATVPARRRRLQSPFKKSFGQSGNSSSQSVSPKKSVRNSSQGGNSINNLDFGRFFVANIGRFL